MQYSRKTHFRYRFERRFIDPSSLNLTFHSNDVFREINLVGRQNAQSNASKQWISKYGRSSARYDYMVIALRLHDIENLTIEIKLHSYRHKETNILVCDAVSANRLPDRQTKKSQSRWVSPTNPVHLLVAQHIVNEDLSSANDDIIEILMLSFAFTYIQIRVPV